MRYKTSLVFLSIFLSTPSLCAGIFEILGGQKVGTTSLTFLKIGVDTRSEGMGQTLVSTSRDASGVYFNPANAISSTSGLTFSHILWLADVGYDYLSLVKNFRNSAVALQVSNLSSGYIEETDELHPLGTGRYFRFADNLLSLTYAFRMTDRFAIGVGAKGIMETLAEINSYVFALDIGTIYNVGYRDIKIGMSLLNMGADARPKGKYTVDGISHSYEAYPLPIVYRIGTSGKLFKNLLVAVEMDKPSDNVEAFKIGCEYSLSSFLQLRSGYRFNAKSPGSSGLSFGAGFVLPWYGEGLFVDYAFSEMGYIGDTHRVGVSLKLPQK
ncbi:hypothetical protein CH333_05300 [candidate division WOR-3 bacterium JGI_Cruoil_03_44_89]|uniref:Type IX secretion system protein PorV domain-containing protein n=1 Tax=candidate division WOR-3 bacterium JGI_Cruoil_03_44_89 TaxID=1973748 RepID=A0A235BTP2_UNCW3|nr:MAG: hypothetical protein CH333_05300 [candidate division WOR-3 bacterium JGI_Cruoil_03_44_89]